MIGTHPALSTICTIQSHYERIVGGHVPFRAQVDEIATPGSLESSATSHHNSVVYHAENEDIRRKYKYKYIAINHRALTLLLTVSPDDKYYVHLTEAFC